MSVLTAYASSCGTFSHVAVCSTASTMTSAPVIERNPFRVDLKYGSRWSLFWAAVNVFRKSYWCRGAEAEAFRGEAEKYWYECDGWARKFSAKSKEKEQWERTAGERATRIVELHDHIRADDENLTRKQCHIRRLQRQLAKFKAKGAKD